MAAKRIRFSFDTGTTWSTLPGSTGERQTELEPVKDTVFGQNWESEQPSIGKWMVSANAYYKGFAGYTAVIKQTGTPTAMTGEATTLVSGKTYQITAASKRVISYTSSLTVLDNGVDQTANVESVDYLSGQVTFKAAYTPTGPITITGSYLPLAVLAKARGFQLTQTSAEIDTSDYETAQANGGWRTYKNGLKTVKLEVTGVYDATNKFTTVMAARSLVIVEVAIDGASANSVFRGFFKRTAHSQKGDVGALEEQTLTFSLWVPDGDLVLAPFKWYIGAGSTLNASVKGIINAFQSSTGFMVEYAPEDDTEVYRGDCIVTEASLSNNFDGQNEFRVNVRGSGAATVV